MSEKITLQSVAESFSRSCGVPKKVAEQFARSFFDTIVDALSEDDSVKINGLGTFRVIDVASRESINVTNGERIVIAGYRKVNFIPEDGLLVSNLIDNMIDVREELGSAEEDDQEDIYVDATDSPSSEVNEQVDEDNEPAEQEEDVNSVEADVNSVVAPSRVEKVEDDFSGIDMLICTPESVEEVRLELEAARVEADRKLAEAKEARREVLRLEVLLNKLENSLVPECVVEEEKDSDTEVYDEQDTDTGDAPADADEELTVSDTETPLVAESVNTTDDSISVELPEQQVVESPDVVEDETSVVVDSPVAEMSTETTETEESSIVDESVVSEESATQESEEACEAIEDVVVSTEDDEKESQDSQDTLEPVEVSGDVQEETIVEDTTDTETESTEADKSKEEALNRFLTETPKIKEEKKKKPKKEEPNYWVWVLAILAIVLLAGVAIIGFKYYSDKAEDELKQLPVQPKNEAAPVTTRKAPSQITKSVVPDSSATKTAMSTNVETKSAEVQKAEGASKKDSSRPKTYELKPGENLTKVSQMFYNTKDSVSAIIRANKFKDVDKVPSGTIINLP